MGRMGGYHRTREAEEEKSGFRSSFQYERTMRLVLSLPTRASLCM
jgi:hypothetical protein